MSFGGGGGGSSSVAGASDVAFSTRSDKQFIEYDTGLGKWTNVGLTGYAALPVNGGAETVLVDNATGAYTLDLTRGNVFYLTVTGDTTLSFSGAPAGKACSIGVYLVQNGTNTVTLPVGVKYAGGTPPTLSTTSGAIDVLVFENPNAGTASWFGSLVGANFS